MKLKFLCLNMWEGGLLFDEILAFIKKEQPDIVALQEVYDGHDESLPHNYRSLDVLRSELKYPHEDFAPAFFDHRDAGIVIQGNAILSKYPLIKSSTVFYDKPFGERTEHVPENFPWTPRNLQEVSVDVNGTILTVFNTQGIWGEDGRDSQRRLEMGKLIAQQVQGKSYTVLAGDFNCNPDTQTIGFIEEYLTNVFSNKLTSTFNMCHKTNPGFATAVVDMVFISSDLKVVSYSCPSINISDHLPLLVEIQLS